MREIEDDSMYDRLLAARTGDEDEMDYTDEDLMDLPDWLEDDDIIGEIDDEDLEDFEDVLGIDDYEDWN